MARNEEKAQSLLNRWTSMKEDFAGAFKNRRPFLASDCDNLPDAEKWRRQVIKEMTKSIAEIQNAGLGEHVIRDLNDKINKLMRERRHWERRIAQLGGGNFGRSQPQNDADGDVLKTSGGYRYFGAAKNLPGVRELFQKDEVDQPKRTREEVYKLIQPDYYGYRDDDDGVLERLEKEVEEKRIKQAVEEWTLAHQEKENAKMVM